MDLFVVHSRCIIPRFYLKIYQILSALCFIKSKGIFLNNDVISSLERGDKDDYES
jgi:hypothetical protein